MNFLALALVALGGAIGSVARALVASFIPAGRLPWATVVVNVLGSFLIGVVAARFNGGTPGDVRAHSFFAVGMCGGFTTFSTFSWQTVDLLHRGQTGAALGNVALSLVCCVFATWLGWRLAQ